jgi:hypothetical protein
VAEARLVRVIKRRHLVSVTLRTGNAGTFPDFAENATLCLILALLLGIECGGVISVFGEIILEN